MATSEKQAELVNILKQQKVCLFTFPLPQHFPLSLLPSLPLPPSQMHIVAAKELSFTEQEFIKVLDQQATCT